MSTIKITFVVLVGLLVTSCGSKSSSDDSSSKVTLSALEEAAASSDSNSGSSSGGGTQCQNNGAGGPPPAPQLSDCQTDAATYCSADPWPTPPTTPPTQGSTPPTDPWAALITCLQSNLSSLSAACQTEVNALPAAPAQPPSGTPPPSSGTASGNPPPPPQGGQGAQGGACVAGHGPLGPCNQDATTYCSSDLPTQGAVGQMTLEQQLTTLETILACLQTNSANLSAACTTALGTTSN